MLRVTSRSLLLPACRVHCSRLPQQEPATGHRSPVFENCRSQFGLSTPRNGGSLPRTWVHQQPSSLIKDTINNNAARSASHNVISARRNATIVQGKATGQIRAEAPLPSPPQRRAHGAPAARHTRRDSRRGVQAEARPAALLPTPRRGPALACKLFSIALSSRKQPCCTRHRQHGVTAAA